MTDKYHFECVDCKTEYPGDKVIYLCPVCAVSNRPGQPPKGVLKTMYDYANIRSLLPHKSAFQWLADRQFLPLLPLRDMDSWPKLRIGDTPLYNVKQWPGGQVDKWTGGQVDKWKGEAAVILNYEFDFELFLKDDSQNPTFSFKDRASALVSAWAHENGIRTLVAASTGNAGSSLGGICASQRQQAVIVVPAAAPLAKLTQILMYGALLVPVKGNYDVAFDLSIEISDKYGFYNRNTSYNPLTIDGKKTVAFELFRQMNHTVPDRIFIPVGDGVIYAGVCKGFEDLMNLGIIDRIPILVGVQSAGSPNLINNLKRDSFVAEPSKTIADSISVDVPKCFQMVSGYMEKYLGEFITVSDEEILKASLQLSRSTGIFSEPAAVAAYAGMLKYRDQGLIQPRSKNVVLLTGSGLKDLHAVQLSIQIPDPVEPDVQSVADLIQKHFAHIR